jgi:hypothetical protein
MDEKIRNTLEVYDFSLESIEMSLERTTNRWAFQELDFKSFIANFIEKLSKKSLI